MKGKVSQFQSLQRQRGVTLIVSLVLLLLLTLLGLASISGTTLEEKMVGNMRDRDLALQASESALREAERYIETSIFTLDDFKADCDKGLCAVRAYSDLPKWKDSSICGGKGVFSDDCNLHRKATKISGVSGAPKYIIEHVTSIDPAIDTLNIGGGYGSAGGSEEVSVFKITVVGTGGSANAKVTLQSTYAKVL